MMARTKNPSNRLTHPMRRDNLDKRRKPSATVSKEDLAVIAALKASVKSSGIRPEGAAKRFVFHVEMLLSAQSNFMFSGAFTMVLRSDSLKTEGMDDLKAL